MGILAFRCDAGQKVGGGHLSRCLTLARYSQRESLLFFVKTQDITALPHEPRVFFEKILEDYDFLKEAELTYTKIPDLKGATIILDISNPLTYSQIHLLPEYLKLLRKKFSKLVLFDGMKEDSIISKIRDLPVDFYITPYIGVPDYSDRGFTHLNGLDYFPLKKEFLSFNSKKTHSKMAEKILISMGQADPFEVSLSALEILKNCCLQQPDFKPHIQVVVGKYFSLELKNKIQSFSQSFENLLCVENKENLGPYFQWCDLAFSTTGTTKYELAYFGVPTVYIAFNPTMEEVHQPFDSLDLSLYLGVVHQFDMNEASSQVYTFLKNQDIREEYSLKSQKLVDGLGAERILKIIS